ncbi:MAG: zinc-dependent alcohol dehydrogenase family protein [Janthinobacterium lividum]
MPKAIRFTQLGGPEVLHIEDVSQRAPGAGEVLLKVEAAGLNRAESMYYHGQYMEQTNLPSGLGYEVIGTVLAVGPDGDTSLTGKRFATIPGYSMGKYPSLAEEAIVPAEVLAAVPESFSAVDGAAVWMQYCTAYGALVTFGKVSAGDFVIITAASSSVGLAAIQIVKAEGGKSIATTRTAAKRDQLLALGADYVIVTDEEDLPARVKEITGGKGARIVFDPVGGDYINTLAQATANGGTIFLYGMLSGTSTPFPMTAFARRIGMFGYTFGELRGTPDWETMKTYIYDRLANGTFKPEIARTFPFEQTVEAYQFLESNQQIGKVVITL